MPDPPTTSQTFHEKLDILRVSPENFKNMVVSIERIPSVVICGIGKPGVGKSQCVHQVGKVRNVPVVTLHIPQMSIEDFHLPTTATDPTDKKYYDRRIPRKFQTLIEFAEVNKEKTPILLIEEPNRARDRNVTTALFTLIEDRVIGDITLPDNIQIIALMNPSENGAFVNKFEQDTASRRRLTFVGVHEDHSEFIDYAIKNNFHPKLVEYLKTHPLRLYDDTAAKNGKVFACPASWETVSQILIAFEQQKKELTDSTCKALVCGKVGMVAANALFNFMQSKVTLIGPVILLAKYSDPDGKVKDTILRRLSEGRHDLLVEEARGVFQYIFSHNTPVDAIGKQLVDFISDLPLEIFSSLISNNFGIESTENNTTYLSKLNSELVKFPKFTVLMDKITSLKKTRNGVLIDTFSESNHAFFSKY